MRAIAKMGVLVAAASVLASCLPETKKFSFKYSEHRYLLANGLKVVVIPDKTSNTSEVHIRYDVGQNEDPIGKKGLAHYVEHIMFQWSGEPFWGKDNPGPALFNVLGSVASSFNAFTTYDTTHYYLVGGKDDWKGLMDLEARRLKMARVAAKADCSETIPTVPKDEFFRELEVVRNEIRWRGGDEDGQVRYQISLAAYPKGHPYADFMGGNDKQLANIKPQDVCDFLRDYYTPSRATLIVTGNVNPEEVKKFAVGYFGPLEKAEAKPLTKIEPIKIKPRTIRIKENVEHPSVNVVFSLPDMNGDDAAAANAMISNILGRLNWLNSQWKFALDIDVGLFGGNKAPVFLIQLVLRSEKDAGKALDYLWKAASGAHRGTEQEAPKNEFKNVAKAAFLSRTEALSARAMYVADRIQFSTKTKFAAEGDDFSEYFLEYFRELESIKDEDFGAFVKRNASKKSALVVIVERDENKNSWDKRDEKTFAGDPHKNRAPAFNPKEAHRPLPVSKEPSLISKAEHYELANGMKVVLMPTDGLPLVQAMLTFSVGGVHEPESKLGLASLTARFLTNLPAQMSLFSLGASVGGMGTSDDATTFSARGIEIYLPLVIKGLERYVSVGDFEQGDIESWQGNFKKRLTYKSYKEGQAFGMAIAGAMYGVDHPYTVKGSATKDTYKNIGRDAMYAFKKKYYTAGNATLVVTGNFKADEAKKTIKENFGSWSRGTIAKPVTTKRGERASTQHLGVIATKKPTTNVFIMYPAPAGMDQNRAARAILSSMLTSRVRVIRTELGASYGTGAGARTKKGPSYYRIGGSIDTARVGESLKRMRDEIQWLRDGKNFDAEFVKARRGVYKAMVTEANETMALAFRLARAELYNLDSDSHDKLLVDVATMTPAKVKALLDKEFDPSKEVLAIQGDREVIAKAYETVGVTQIAWVDPFEGETPKDKKPGDDKGPATASK